MKFRYFGPLHRSVSEIGFGSWAIGGEFTLAGRVMGWGPTERDESIRAIRKAVELGVNFFDTADIYGGGRSEETLGEVLRRYPDVVICTKFGVREAPALEVGRDFSRDWLTHSVENSLKRLRRERLDVVLAHSPPDDFNWGTFDHGGFDRLIKEGKVASYGVSCRSVRSAHRVLSAGFGRVIEVIYNAIDRRAEEVFAHAKTLGYGTIARVPLASGFLSEKQMSNTDCFPATDYRSRLSVEELNWRREAVKRIDFLKELPGGMAVSAIRFCLSNSAVDTVIPGMRTVAQVEGNIPASEHGPLTLKMIERIRQAIPDVYTDWR